MSSAHAANHHNHPNINAESPPGRTRRIRPVRHRPNNNEIVAEQEAECGHPQVTTATSGRAAYLAARVLEVEGAQRRWQRKVVLLGIDAALAAAVGQARGWHARGAS